MLPISICGFDISDCHHIHVQLSQSVTLERGGKEDLRTDDKA